MYMKLYGLAHLPTITEEYNRRKARELDKQRRSQIIVKKIPNFPPLERVDHKESDYINSVLGEFELIKQCGLFKEYGILKPKSYLVTPPTSPIYSQMAPPEPEKPKDAANKVQKVSKVDKQTLTDIYGPIYPTKRCLKCLKRKENRKIRKTKEMAEKKAQSDRLLMPPPQPARSLEIA